MTGFNSDIRVGGDHYHVQTQVTPGGVETLIYMGGQVVFARRCEQAEQDSASAQHQEIVGVLEHGELDLFVGDGHTEVETLADSLTEEPDTAPGLFARLAELIGSHKRRRQDPPKFWVDVGALRRVGDTGSGAVEARLTFPGGRAVAGATVEVERFDLFGPPTRLKSLITDSNGNLSISCEVGPRRPAGLVLRTETDGRQATARYLI